MPSLTKKLRSIETGTIMNWFPTTKTSPSVLAAMNRHDVHLEIAVSRLLQPSWNVPKVLQPPLNLIYPQFRVCVTANSDILAVLEAEFQIDENDDEELPYELACAFPRCAFNVLHSGVYPERALHRTARLLMQIRTSVIRYLKKLDVQEADKRKTNPNPEVGDQRAHKTNANPEVGDQRAHKTNAIVSSILSYGAANAAQLAGIGLPVATTALSIYSGRKNKDTEKNLIQSIKEMRANNSQFQEEINKVNRSSDEIRDLLRQQQQMVKSESEKQQRQMQEMIANVRNETSSNQNELAETEERHEQLLATNAQLSQENEIRELRMHRSKRDALSQ